MIQRNQKPILLLASGTLGDVLPQIALGRALNTLGCQARIVTHAPFRAMSEAAGLGWAPLEGNPNALLADPVFAHALRFDGSPLRTMRDTWRYLDAARAELARMLRSAWRVAGDAGCIVVGLPTTWGQTIAERLDIPCVWTLCQPISRTGAFPSPFQPWSGSLGRAYNRLSHRLAEQALWLPWRAELERWRGELGLPRRPADPFKVASCLRSPFVYLFSPHLVPRPSDWPAHHVVAGDWAVQDTQDWRLGEPLARFLDHGAPIYIGFGSMAAGREPELAGLVFAAVARTGRRAVLQIGRPELVPAAPPEVLVTGPGHLGPILERCAAAIHHGGAGTTHAGIRAGLPTATTPFGVDQYFWGRRVAALGAGLPPLGARKLCPERLAALIDALLGDSALRRNAERLGRSMRSENGVAVAAEAIRAGMVEDGA